jgi:hypothetical protein
VTRDPSKDGGCQGSRYDRRCASPLGRGIAEVAERRTQARV